MLRRLLTRRFRPAIALHIDFDHGEALALGVFFIAARRGTARPVVGVVFRELDAIA